MITRMGLWAAGLLFLSFLTLGSTNTLIYKGCYKDGSNRDFTVRAKNIAHSTPKNCLQRCLQKDQKYKVVGLQFGGQCFCGTTAGRYGKADSDSECSFRCGRDKAQSCGGKWRNSVYEAIGEEEQFEMTDEATNTRFYTNNLKLGYLEAKRMCSSRNMKIVTIRTTSERKRIENSISNKLRSWISRTYWVDDGMSRQVQGKRCLHTTKTGRMQYEECEREYHVLCETANCDLPKPIKNGYSATTRQTEVGSQIRFSCMAGFKLRGVHQSHCQSDGSWSAATPTCTEMCDDLGTLENGQVLRTRGNLGGSEATMSCNRGFHRQGPGRLTCDTDGRWSGAPPQCQDVTCDTFSLKHGYVQRSMMDREDSVAALFCKNGYERRGTTDRAVCRNQEWVTDGEAVCSKSLDSRPCGSLGDLDNGFIQRTRGNQAGSQATFQCAETYKLIGSDSSTCRNGSWTPTRPECVQMLCQPLSLVHGAVTLTNGHVVGSTARFACDRGYYMIGSDQSTCSPSESWTEAAPTCERVRCPDIPPRKAMTVTFSDGHFLDSIVSFECRENHILIPETLKIQCLDGGRWSKDVPDCKEQKCPDIPRPAHSQVERTKGLEPGSVARFKCNEGYELIGETYAICQQKDFTWTSQPPICSDCKTQLLNVEGCRRPIVGDKVRLYCSGTACSNITRTGDVYWSMRTPAYRGDVTFGEQIVAPFKNNFDLKADFDDEYWQYYIDVKVDGRDLGGKYTCTVEDETKDIKLKPISAKKWGSVSCSGGVVTLLGKNSASYVELKNDDVSTFLRVADNNTVSLPTNMAQTGNYELQVCFCEQSFFPTGCVKTQLQCN